MTGLSLVLLLLARGPREQTRSDGGTPPAPAAPAPPRTEEDQEVIRNLDLLEHLAESQTLDVLLELDPDRPDDE